MRFALEQRHLTTEDGQPVADRSAAVTFHQFDAASVDEAMAKFVADHAAEVIGEILRLPGFQAMATLRNLSGVFTLEIAPASSRLPIKK